jgi:hypothetical protein
LPSGVTVSSTNIVNGTIVDTDINASAAIAGSKISPSFTAPSVISVNSSSDALRITQTGTGNALVVEDSTNPDATPFVVDSSGNTIIGNTGTFETRFGVLSVSPPLQVIGTIGSNASTLGARFSDDNSASSAFFAKSRSTNRGEHAIVSLGDALGNISFSGSDGTKMVEAARIIARVDDSPAESNMAGRIEFYTTPSGSQLVVERMRISQDGVISMRNNSGLQIARTSVTSPATEDGNVFSGTYTPTLTNLTNIDSTTAFGCQYIRVGNFVTVSGAVAVGPTASGFVDFRMSLPVGSNIAGGSNLGGTCVAQSTVAMFAGSIAGDASTDTATFRIVQTGTLELNYYFTFSYRVI